MISKNENLDDTGRLSSEFGRTPKVNKNAGRDHWGKCNTIWMAGAGIPGQMYGKSDSCFEPVEDAVSPVDVSATIFHLLGLELECTLMHSDAPSSIRGQSFEKFLRS